MSEEKVIIKEEKKPSYWQRLRGAFSRTPQMQDTWNRMKRAGGFIPLLDFDDTESRRAELRLILNDIQKDFETLGMGNCYECSKVETCNFFQATLTQSSTQMLEVLNTKKDCCVKTTPYEFDVVRHKIRTVNRVFALFFSAGSPWYRGLDDRELAKKVKAFLELWNYVGDNEAFVDDLFMCSMQMLNLSWKALDVTNVPPYIIESKTVYEMKGERVDLQKEVETY